MLGQGGVGREHPSLCETREEGRKCTDALEKGAEVLE